jgi:hydrogenase maturation factor
VVEVGDRCLVLKTDPITFATDEIGWYAVHINANDIATSCATPKWFLATVLLPAGQATEELARRIMRQMGEACAEIGASLVGGHTEITYGLDRPIVVGQMIGEVPRGHLICTAGARPADLLLLTKGLGIEGAAIVAREKPDRLRALGYSEQRITELRNLIYAPGISVLRDARLACEAGHVHAMHDPTEGGVATGVWELALAANVGVEVDAEALDRLNPYGEMFQRLGLDPLGVIASGALLIAAPAHNAERIMWHLVESGIRCAVIGAVTSGRHGCTLRRGDSVTDLPRYDRDEIAKLFA